MFPRFLAFFLACFALVTPAYAEIKVATVDFERAMNDVSEGAQAKARLDAMYADRRAAVEKLKSTFEAKQADYQKQAMVMSDSARLQKEQELNTLGAQYQQAASQAEGEMQQAYMGTMQTLAEKMKKIVQTIAGERQYTLVLESSQGGVLYAAPSIDITDELIKRYNAANPVSSGK